MYIQSTNVCRMITHYSTDTITFSTFRLTFSRQKNGFFLISHQKEPLTSKYESKMGIIKSYIMRP